MLFVGIDTSNYTTSAAIYDSENGTIVQKKKLLPVKQGELGLRQSDAVFHHTVQLPDIIEEIFRDFGGNISAVGASFRPRNAEKSYMPCFNVGAGTARSIAAVLNIPIYDFSHQSGHIAAAIYSSGEFSLFEKEFVAFHVSGGTTEAVLCHPDDEKILCEKMLVCSLDLKAGQAVDRTGVMLGLPFPAGKYVDKLAQKSKKRYKINIKLKEGCCSLSGVENKVKKMKEEMYPDEDICRFCIDYISCALEKMAEYILIKYGDHPLLFSGGVMSNSIIQNRFRKKFGAFFASPEFSCDNAAGIALLTGMKFKKGNNI